MFSRVSPRFIWAVECSSFSCLCDNENAGAAIFLEQDVLRSTILHFSFEFTKVASVYTYVCGLD